MPQFIPEEPVFPALPRFSCRGSTHTTVARGTALWESLVGKPRGKVTDPLIHATGGVTLLLQAGRKAHVHAPTQDEEWLSCGDSRSTTRSMSALERNPQVTAKTPRKVFGSDIAGRGIQKSPLATRWGLAFPQATRACPWGPRHDSRGPAANREYPGGSQLQAR